MSKCVFSEWPPPRLLLLILPPSGVASRPIYDLSAEKGECGISVDLLKGIVVDADKLESPRTGDTVIAVGIGGGDFSVIHSDSILRRRLIVE